MAIKLIALAIKDTFVSILIASGGLIACAASALVISGILLLIGGLGGASRFSYSHWQSWILPGVITLVWIAVCVVFFIILFKTFRKITNKTKSKLITLGKISPQTNLSKINWVTFCTTIAVIIIMIGIFPHQTLNLFSNAIIYFFRLLGLVNKVGSGNF